MHVILKSLAPSNSNENECSKIGCFWTGESQITVAFGLSKQELIDVCTMLKATYFWALIQPLKFIRVRRCKGLQNDVLHMWGYAVIWLSVRLSGVGAVGL